MRKTPVQRPSFRASHNIIYVFGGQIDFQVSVAYGLVSSKPFPVKDKQIGVHNILTFLPLFPN